MTFTWETDQLDFLRTHTWAVSPPVAEVFGALSGNLPPAANDIVAMLDWQRRAVLRITPQTTVFHQWTTPRRAHIELGPR